MFLIFPLDIINLVWKSETTKVTGNNDMTWLHKAMLCLTVYQAVWKWVEIMCLFWMVMRDVILLLLAFSPISPLWLHSYYQPSLFIATFHAPYIHIWWQGSDILIARFRYVKCKWTWLIFQYLSCFCHLLALLTPLPVTHWTHWHT